MTTAARRTPTEIQQAARTVRCPQCRAMPGDACEEDADHLMRYTDARARRLLAAEDIWTVLGCHVVFTGATMIHVEAVTR